MCGIAGIVRFDGKPIEPAWFDAMKAILTHRGPDGHGTFHDRVESSPHRNTSIEVGFVHTRLSILDHEGGIQPMVPARESAHMQPADQDTVAVVFNGCIYNHRSLRSNLEAHGHRFATDHSDTEVLVHGHRQWANDLPEHLEGMYAYAVWDRSAGSITLVRDRAGEKPLYYWMDDELHPGVLVFSSTVPGVVESVNLVAPRSQGDNGRDARSTVNIRRTLADGFCSDDLPLKGFHRLSPGTSLTICAGDSEPRVELRRYWTPPAPESRTQSHHPANPIDHLDSLIRESVEARLEADVPLGLFLSGGVDSSLIAHYARQKLGALNTFCVRMPDARYDESQHAESVATHLDTTHTTLEVDPNPADDLLHLVDQLGLPFGDSSILPTYWVSRAARQHVKVALTGDGGDELFWGYERYAAANWLGRYHSLLRFVPWIPFHRAHPKSPMNKLARLGSAARHDGYADLVRIFPRPMLDELAPSLAETHQTPRNDNRIEPIAQAVYSDFTSYLPNDLLCKIDTASMSVALEVRAPFLDTQVMEFALSLSKEALMPNGQRKGLLRNLARRHLPPMVLDRPKMGFAIPVGQWFRDDFGQMKTLLMDTLDASSEPFGPLDINLKYVRRLIREHMDSRTDHSQRLFFLLTLARWAQSL